ncbi:MAG: hypothetical protein CMB80_04050 [Flammeovirgaceae bacterium]|nr:hypothetical protein [Flammeovirgaceae bacterium]MBE62593.1 hypothetical protein [Flammeovirgaceae bacterium]HCX20479.1 hypothetical protein [Cytophagales bacterium]
MPANKKYFSSPLQRFAKISAGFIGGYFVTVSFFMTLSMLLDRAGTMVTLVFGGFIMWAGLMICAFLIKNGWVTWGLYFLLTLIFSAIFYLNYSH